MKRFTKKAFNYLIVYKVKDIETRTEQTAEVDGSLYKFLYIKTKKDRLQWLIPIPLNIAGGSTVGDSLAQLGGILIEDYNRFGNVNNTIVSQTLKSGEFVGTTVKPFTTYQSRGQTTVRLTILCSPNSKYSLLLSSFLNFASGTLNKIRFVYLDNTNIDSNLVLDNVIKTKAGANDRYILSFIVYESLGFDDKYSIKEVEAEVVE